MNVKRNTIHRSYDERKKHDPQNYQCQKKTVHKMSLISVSLGQVSEQKISIMTTSRRKTTAGVTETAGLLFPTAQCP